MQENFDQELLGRLKKEKMTPAPRWHFLLKNYSIWTLGVASFAVGSVSFALIIHLVRNNDWAIYDEISGSLWQFIFLTLPYFWIILLALFLSVMYYNLRHTKGGYHYSVPAILSLCIISSFGGGLLLHKFAMGQAIDDLLGEKAPYYRELINPQARLWDAPEQGRLIGIISSSTGESNFYLIDFRDKKWLIQCGFCQKMMPVSIIISEPVRLLGEMVDEDTFSASRILPVQAGRGLFCGHSFGPGSQMMAVPFCR